MLALGAGFLPHAGHSLAETFALIAVALILGDRSFRTPAAFSSGDRLIFPLQWGLAFISAAYLGFPAAVFVITLGALVSKSHLPYASIPNRFRGLVSITFACLLSSVINAPALSKAVPFEIPGSVPALSVSILVFWAALAAGESGLSSFAQASHSFRHFITKLQSGLFPIAGLLLLSALLLFGFEGNLGVAMLFFAPFVILTHQGYQANLARSAEREHHITELRTKQAQLSDLYLATVKSLALAIDAKDQYTHQHILRVQHYSEALATEMGLKGDEYEAVSTGALLHDIGKLGVPEYVLLKPGKLTKDEFDKVKLHPEIGAAILEPVPFPWPVLPAVKSHHERWDGKGYPEGLSGENIPLIARILSVADVYDALTSSRSYRIAWDHEKAKSTIIESSGTQFDPKVVEAFERIIDGIVEKMALDGEGPLATAAAQQAKRANDPTTQVARQISRASSDLWALYEVAQSLSNSLGVRESLEMLGKKLQSAFPGSTCTFLTKGFDDEALTVSVSVGENYAFLHGASTTGDGSISAQVFRDRKSFRGEFDHDDIMLNSVDSEPWEQFSSCLIVPVIYDDEPLGTMNLYHAEESQYNEQDQQLLETVAENVGMALYNFKQSISSSNHGEIDPLTETYNARFMTRVLEERCYRRNVDDTFSILVVDIDGFRPFNEVFGHHSGDDLLKKLTRVIEQCISERGTLARYGGDEFIIMLDGLTLIEAHQVKSEIHAAIRNENFDFYHEKIGHVGISVSIGVATFPLDGTDFTRLMSNAERSMHREKSESKLRAFVIPEAA